MSNLAKVQAYYSASARRNMAAARNVMADDIVWHIPGHHPLAGAKRGIVEVLAFHDQLAKAGFRTQSIMLAEQGDYVMEHQRGWTTAGPGLDLTWCRVFRFADGKILEITNYCEDQHKADLFFNEFYRLKPLPDRLA